MERMCQRQLLPAAWVALDGGADNIPALQGGAPSHLGQCWAPGKNVPRAWGFSNT